MLLRSHLDALQAADAGPALAALRTQPAWTTLDHHTDLWAAALHHLAARPSPDDDTLATLGRGAELVAARIEPPQKTRPRASDDAWRKAWRSLRRTDRPPRAFLDLAHKPVLAGARRAASRPDRLSGHLPPSHRVNAFVAELSTDLHWMLTPQERMWHADAGWRDVAVHVLSQGAQAFVQMRRAAGEGLSDRVGLELLQPRRIPARSAEDLWPTLKRRQRAVYAARRVARSEDGLQALAEVHTWLRGLRSPRADTPTLDGHHHGAVVTWDHTCRALRSACLHLPAPSLLRGVLRHGSLARASEGACVAYGWRLGERVRQQGLLNILDPLPRPCGPPPDDLPDVALRRTWVLLALLRGQEGALRAWLGAPGGTKTGGSGWNGVRAALPVDDADDAQVRMRLAIELEDHVEALVPCLSTIADLPSTPRGLHGRLARLLQPIWHPAVPLPPGGSPRLRRSARSVLDSRRQGPLSHSVTRQFPPQPWDVHRNP